MPIYPRFSKRTDFYTAHRNSVRAFLRGDHAAAKRWHEVALHRVSNARTDNDLINHRPIPRLKAAKPKPLPPSMPVMLDPKGFSPGGQPNWFLNQQRLERAGLKAFPEPPRQKPQGERRVSQKRPYPSQTGRR